MSVNGVLNVYKPMNISSNNIVIGIKKILGIKKVGHTGTLDPLACGVLPICIGSSTKISEYLTNKDKTYKVKIRFGILTDTYDLEGKVLNSDKDFKIDNFKLINALESFVGEYEQYPPIYSAIKINGNRAYNLARKGLNFELKPRKVIINFINEINIENENECSFVVKCSKGTYIRSLCKDIGERLGTYATMIFLERIQSGIFVKKDSVKFEDLTIEKIKVNVIPINKIISMPKLEINEQEIYRLLINGVCIRNPKYIDKINDGTYFLYYNNELIGICQRKSNFLKMIKFLN